MESHPSRKIERPQQNKFGLQIHGFVLKGISLPSLSHDSVHQCYNYNLLSTTLFTLNKTLSLYFPTPNVAKNLGI